MAGPVVSERGLVATAHPEATRAGLEILRSGGNAVDAAIAANAALGVVEPMMCGIGGDLMAMVWDGRSQRCTGLIGEGCAPRELSVDRVRSAGLERLTPRHPFTWTVPGCVQAWAAMTERWGTKSLDELLAPAVRLAEEGCPVPPVIARLWRESADALWGDGPRIYLPGGRAPRAGEVFRNPDLARTLRQIGHDWRDFYGGSTAAGIVAFSRASGGLIGEEDFDRRGASEWCDPLATAYRRHTVHALPMPTQGLCVLQMLNMLEGEDLARRGFGSEEALHRLIEAKKLSFEDRARWIHDHSLQRPDIEARLISKEHAHTRWRRFDPEAASRAIPDDMASGSETTYLCAADEEGNAVSLIQSIYHAWGSGAVPAGLGFCLQNRGLGFSLDPGHPCCVAPGKRPLHTIIPGFALRDGRPWLCFGVMGGTMQPQGQVQILTDLIDFGMDVQQAGEAPRWRHEGSSDVDGTVMRGGGVVHVEPGFSEKALAALRAKGHRLSHEPVSFGGYQAILFDHARGAMLGASDPRKDGCAMGL